MRLVFAAIFGIIATAVLFSGRSSPVAPQSQSVSAPNRRISDDPQTVLEMIRMEHDPLRADLEALYAHALTYYADGVDWRAMLEVGVYMFPVQSAYVSAKQLSSSTDERTYKLIVVKTVNLIHHNKWKLLDTPLQTISDAICADLSIPPVKHSQDTLRQRIEKRDREITAARRVR